MFGYDAPRWHALLNDLPAALLVAAVLFDLVAAARKRESLAWAGIWTLWAGVIGGWAAVIAGELAEGSLEHGTAIHQLMEKHEKIGLLTMSVFSVVLIWKMLRRFQLPTQELAITRFLSVIGLAGLAWTGILGGRLMFEHAAGIATPTLQTEIRNRTAGHEHAPGEEHDEPMGAATDGAPPAPPRAPGDTAKATHPHPPGTPPHKH
jgi:uncharacterized membrane protein